jgi:predicted small lipoprotein YifL
MIFRSILLMAIALAAQGCGLKGALYLPDESKQEVHDRTTAPGSTEEQQKKERGANPSGPQPPAIPTDTSPSTTPPEN